MANEPSTMQTRADPSATETLIESTPSRPQLARLDRGRSLGRYVVIDVLGAGSMGVVYRAYDPDLDRALAVKLVALDASGDSRGAHEQGRLLREAQAMARVSHPNIIQVFDVGSLDDAVYVAMELVDGCTLGEWLVPERTPAAILRIFDAAGRGLAAAHARGLIHRDFKPDNVMLDREDVPKVLDFGLARAQAREATTERDELRSGEHSGPTSLEASMTQAGSIMGTPAYMSPEQHRGDTASDKSDQFSFCVALFEALIGRRPFSGASFAALSVAVTSGKIELPSRTPVSRGVMKAILRGLEVDPDARHPSMNALLTALRRGNEKTRGLGVLLGAAGLAIGAAAWLRSPQEVVEPPSPCATIHSSSEEIWNEQRGNTIAARFAASEVAASEKIWSATAPLFDRWEEGWTAGRLDACEATHVRGEQSATLLDRRIACYDRQLGALDSTLDVLEQADRTSVLHATDAALSLPDVERCADVERLLERLPRPTDPQQLAVIEALEERQAAADAQFRLGHYEQQTSLAEQLASDADDADFAPVRAQAHYLYAELLANTGQDAQAREAYDTALFAAIEARDDELATTLALRECNTVGNVLADVDGGRRYLQLARAFAFRLGERPELRIRILAAEASLQLTQGAMEASLASHLEVLAYWEEHAPEGATTAGAMMDVAAVLASIGRAEEAVDYVQRSVALREAIFGAQHPETATALRELGSALSKLERFDEANDVLSRALEIQRSTRGPTSRYVAILLDDLGRIARSQNRLEDAAARHREAFAVWDSLFDEPNPALVVSQINIGYTLNAAGKFDEAFEAFKRALELAEVASGPEHPHIVYAANAAASVLVDMDRWDEAWPYAKRALDLDGKADVPPTLFAETRFIGAHALWRGDGNVPKATRDRAIALARRAKEIYVAGPPHWAPDIERIDAWLADNG